MTEESSSSSLPSPYDSHSKSLLELWLKYPFLHKSTVIPSGHAKPKSGRGWSHKYDSYRTCEAKSHDTPFTACTANRVMASCVLLSGLLLLAIGAVAADEKIYVHVVPHTHDDVGWLKTVDEYFYGGIESAYYAHTTL